MRQPRSLNSHRGAAVVEMALLLPVLLMIVFGIADYGRFFFIRSAVTAAVADAARTAVLPAVTTEEITLAVGEALAGPITHDSGENALISVVPEVRLPGDTVTVTATLPFQALILPGFLGTRLFPQTVTASATMTMEP
ncbi:TadE/TadG family type IV pilus assembly protein [Desulfolutivibrio sp.]|uniref:TadE/TadG family type IV pilus assembly protein n=1 Tax=Desulfolutivibrio sp. TaxID=2773296 RepID=UPI002F962166